MLPEYWDALFLGLTTTIQLSIYSIVLSLLLGTLIGILRIAPLSPLRVLSAGYVEIFRNIPLLIVLAFIFYGLPKTGISLPAFESGLLGLSIYTAAFVAEVVRSGLQSIGFGQIEAARALGLSYIQMLRLVLLPQAFRLIIPPLGTTFIALVKNTSVTSAITVTDIIYQSEFIEGRTFSPDIFLTAGAIYLVITIPLSALVNLAENRLKLARR